MIDDVHEDDSGADAVSAGAWGMAPGLGDGPGLSRSLLDDLARVLTGFGGSARDVERLVRSVAATSEAEAVTDILQARPPERAAWIAPADGYLNEVGSGYLLTDENAPGDDYVAVKWSLTAGGSVLRWSGGREGWLFGPLDGRELRVPLGSRVEAGEPLTDGIGDPHDLLRILGEARTVAAVSDRLAGLCTLDLEAAERVVRPLFDAVEIVEGGFGGALPGLRPGTLCTRRRFRTEHGRAISRALRDLPPSADPRLHALAGIRDDAERAKAFYGQRLSQVADDAGLSISFAAGRPVHLGCTDLAVLLDQGGAIPAGTRYDVGSFEVTSGTLRVADPCYLEERAPEIDRLLGVTLPAQVGTWRAFSFVADRDERGPRVSELRMWADGHSARFGHLPDDESHVLVDSGMAGCFDLGNSNRISPTNPQLVEAVRDRLMAAGPSRAAVVDDHGVVAETGFGDGRYRASAWRNDAGAVVAVSLYLDDWAG
ncbi:hypothetical protein [Kitasatospora aureofaciens]|uniref:hypothetical protein n=1 Tax=Kitasatospora aureofaciens TaxID=1894 RepID=UPI001C4688E5|nr:hypothetical protein [Kitasatospora aureofaciens]MBV6702322.1 hypothetical protein [Kitasatospora aureofaciens]